MNVANLGRKPYRSLSGDVTWILQDRLRLLLRGEVVWVKAKGATGSCAWGSFQKPANPVLRDLSERIVIASKGRFDRAVSASQRAKREMPSEATITRDEFMEATTDLWEIPTESATKVGHPAPFPVELPERLIHLYTYRGDLVLDPFMGSGTTAVAAIRAQRHFVGYDTDPGYVERARQRIELERTSERSDPPADAARTIARRLLERRGYTDIAEKVKFPVGVAVDFAAYDSAGIRWLFDVAGGFTTAKPGLRRADELNKVIAKAAILHAAYPEAKFVVMTSALPTSGAAGLNAVTGPGQPIHEIVLLSGP